MRNQTIEVTRVLANTLYQFCRNGLSININGEFPTSGYMVSFYGGPVFNSIADVDVSQVKKFLDDNLPYNEGYYAGVWTDEKTGKIYFDVSYCYDNLQDAVRRAVNADQIAIWDVEGNKEIRTNQVVFPDGSTARDYKV